MPHDPGAGDPLLRAIADCRVVLDRLIDEQVSRLSGLEEPKPRRTTKPAPVTPPPSPDLGDPRERLDALAKRLDGRLKRFGESEEDRP